MENLDLIDWRMVGFASMWTTGLAVILTALGFADYHSKVESERMRDLLKRPNYQISINGGLALFCLGVLGSSDVWWETAIWTGLAVAFLAYTASSVRALRRDKAEDVSGPDPPSE